MKDRNQDKYEILKALALAGSRGEGLQATAETALQLAAELVGLNAAALFLWDSEMQVTLSVSHADSETNRERLQSLEDDLFGSLRQDKKLTSAYLSFDSDQPYHSFTLPLRQGGDVLGAVIGLQNGERTIVAEDSFLEALSAAIALHVIATGGGAAIPKELLDKERLSAIVDTAVTVNHEINNPLTAILGNVQLLLLKHEDLDDELKAKLKVIEESAGRIRDVTQKLMQVTTPRTVEYTSGTNMLDLSDKKSPDEPESEE